MPFPSPPWRMQGQMWLTLLKVPTAGPGNRPAGVYGVGMVDYQPGSILTYGELLVARQVTVRAPADKAGKHVTVTDIWVDSAPSRDGGRSLWAVPKDLATFTWEERAGRVACAVEDDRGPIARVTVGLPRVTFPRVPFSGTTWQPREDGSSVTSSLTGSARSFPVRSAWEFVPEGPLGWLVGARPLATVAMRDFRMTFG